MCNVELVLIPVYNVHSLLNIFIIFYKDAHDLQLVKSINDQ